MHTARYLMITDAIGLSMLLSPQIVRVMSPSGRVAVACTGFVLSWVGIGLWHPSAFGGRLLRETFFGSLHPSLYVYTFPLLPWFCVDLLGTTIGGRLGNYMLKGDYTGGARWLRLVGAGSMLLGLSGRIAGIAFRHLADGFGIEGWLRAAVETLCSPHVKFPPSPVYVCFFGGLGIILLSACLEAENRGLIAQVIRYAASLGQTSLVMFVTQFYLFYTVLYLLRPRLPLAGAWPVYLLLSIMIVVQIARIWHRRGYRKYLTVGLVALGNQRSTHRAIHPLPSLATNV
jgi:hypothetical protein